MPYDYEMPDDNHIFGKFQKISCLEAFFKPYMIEKLDSWIGKECYNLIQKCDIDIKRYLYNAVILSGDTSKFNELAERLTKEIKILVAESMKEKVKIIVSPERKFNAWIGWSILSSISTFESNWNTKNEY